MAGKLTNFRDAPHPICGVYVVEDSAESLSGGGGVCGIATTKSLRRTYPVLNMQPDDLRGTKIKIAALLIEDSPDDAELLKASLCEQDFSSMQVRWCQRLSDGLALLKSERFDVVLLDLSLPDSNAIQTVISVRNALPSIPIVILSGLDDQEAALEALKEGAQDYLLKGKSNGDSVFRAVRYAIERKRAEESLRDFAAQAEDAQEKMRMTLVASQTGVWSLNLIDHSLEWDDQVKEILGFADDVKPSRELWSQRVHPDDKPRVMQAVDDCIAAKCQYDVKYRIILPDQTVRHVASVGKVLSDGGRPTRMTGICRNITKNEEQQDTERRLAILEQRQEFVAMLAHDLRNPVIGSQRVLALLKDESLGPLSGAQIEVLEKLSNSNQSMLLMINNILDSYRLESNSETFDRAELNVQQLIDQCVCEMAPLAQNKHIEIITKSTITNHVIADQLAMRRIMCNLISNSIKFMPNGGVIEISSYEHDGLGLIELKDNGPGVEQQNLEKIFDRFWQGERRHRAQGLGLGLYLCRKFMEAQEGTIRCSSSVGKGTTFHLTLPLKHAVKELAIA